MLCLGGSIRLMKNVIRGILIYGLITLQGCFTIPPIDQINTTYSTLPSTPTPIAPLSTPQTTVSQINRPQTLNDKLKYLNTCMINYSWGRGWTDKTNFTD